MLVDSMEKIPKILMKTNRGEIIIRLSPEFAPETVANFLILVEKGFYNGLLFHSVIPNFIVQGGDPLTRDPSKREKWGTGGSGYKVKNETEGNSLKFKPGAISMVHMDKNIGSSQFFIALTRVSTKHLDGLYTIFGHVVKGMDIVNKIQQEDKIIEITVI